MEQHEAETAATIAASIAAGKERAKERERIKRRDYKRGRRSGDIVPKKKRGAAGAGAGGIGDAGLKFWTNFGPFWTNVRWAVSKCPRGEYNTIF